MLGAAAPLAWGRGEQGERRGAHLLPLAAPRALHEEDDHCGERSGAVPCPATLRSHHRQHTPATHLGQIWRRCPCPAGSWGDGARRERPRARWVSAPNPLGVPVSSPGWAFGGWPQSRGQCWCFGAKSPSTRGTRAGGWVEGAHRDGEEQRLQR